MDGDVRFNIGANTAQFDAKMAGVGNVANTTAGKIKSAFSGLGGILAGGAILAGLKSMMNDFDRVGKLATRFGTSAESIQRVSVAADVAGTNIEQVANAMTKAGIAASKAVERGGEMAELFDRAGINAREFAKANIDEKLLMIAEAYRAAGNDAQKTNAIIEIMGSRSGANLIPLIQNVEALRAEMAGVSVATDETVRAIEQANDRMTRFGNTIKVSFAAGLQSLSNFSERLGNVLAGGLGKTIAELDEQEMRANAEARLRARGELLEDDSTRRKIVVPTPAGPVVSEADEFVPGPNAEENVRRITAELEKMRAEIEAAKAPTAAITDELDEQASKTEQRKQQQQQLKQIALEIKEATAAGNQALAEDLREYEALVKAAIDYEGDLEMAARDVNAAHKERLRLQQEALQKSIAQVEQEVQLAEAMAFGTEEAKSRAQWLKVYDEIMAKTGRDDLARRAANAETAEEDSPSRSGRGESGAASDRAMTRNERIAEMQGNARARRDQELAARYESAGFFGSAVSAQDRAARRRDEAMAGARMKDMFESEYGASNLGEAFSKYKSDAPLDNRLTEEQFNEFYRSMAKTPEQRAREEAKRAGKEKEAAAQPTPIDDILRIIKEHLPAIDEKLPQHALV